MKRIILALIVLPLAAAFTSCDSPKTAAEAAKRQRELAIGDKLLKIGTRLNILTKEEADDIRDIGTLAVPTNPPAAVEVTSGK